MLSNRGPPQTDFLRFFLFLAWLERYSQHSLCEDAVSSAPGFSLHVPLLPLARLRNEDSANVIALFSLCKLVSGVGRLSTPQLGRWCLLNPRFDYIIASLVYGDVAHSQNWVFCPFPAKSLVLFTENIQRVKEDCGFCSKRNNNGKGRVDDSVSGWSRGHV